MKTLILSILLLLVAIGCKELNTTTTPPIDQKKTENVIKDTETKLDNINKSAQNINTSASNIENKAPEAVKKDIKPDVDSIKKEAVSIITEASVLKAIVPPAIKDLNQNNIDIAKERDKVMQELKEQKEREDNKARAIFFKICVGSSLLCVGAIALFLVPWFKFKELALNILVFAGIVASASGVIYTYYQYFVLVGLAGLAIYGVFFGYRLVKFLKSNKEELNFKDQVSDQAVHFIEIIKEELVKLGDSGIKLRKRLFGEGLAPDGIADKVFTDPYVKQEIQKKRTKVPIAKSLNHT